MSRPLEAEIGEGLKAGHATLAVAESCTGGLLGARLTSVSGSSDYFLGGIVAYSNAAKVRDLGVDAEVVEREGAVSEPVARQMAEGVRRRFGADYGIGVTGVAGPTGGTPSKPVGLVFVAVAGPRGCAVHSEVFPGDRAAVRERSVAMALRMLTSALTGG